MIPVALLRRVLWLTWAVLVLLAPRAGASERLHDARARHDPRPGPSCLAGHRQPDSGSGRESRAVDDDPADSMVRLPGAPDSPQALPAERGESSVPLERGARPRPPALHGAAGVPAAGESPRPPPSPRPLS